MPAPGAQGGTKKQIAIKHEDGEPLTRSDVQYDLLYYLFSDQQAVFTDTYTTLHGDPAGTKVTFRDLYVNALVHSSRCSKISRNKLLDAPQFADEFAKISLLSNINRINTTMAFFPEMRTALRTYHSVPSLQKTNGNLQDAPRIKNILKSCLLPTELQNTPATPSDVLSRVRTGIAPPTSIVNLIFIFQSHSSILAQTHFPPSVTYELQDFFTPINVSSESRARAFLWLCYHYYEASSPNPFNDKYSEQHPGTIPKLYDLSSEEAHLENVDTPEEKRWGEEMLRQRKQFMANKDKAGYVAEASEEAQEGQTLPQSAKPKVTKGGKGTTRTRAPRDNELPILTPRVRRNLIAPPKDSLQATSSSRSLVEDPVTGPSQRPYPMEGQVHLDLLPLDQNHQLSLAVPPSMPSPPLRPSPPDRNNSSIHVSRSPPIPPRQHLVEPSTLIRSGSSDGGPIRHTRRARRKESGRPVYYPPDSPLPAYRPLERHRNDSYHSSSFQHPAIPSSPPPSVGDRLPPANRPMSYRHRASKARLGTSYTHPPVSQPRTMLEQAWQVVMTTDPLSDSDGEQDENTRLDLLLRLKIINRLRGKEPTPEPEDERLRYASPTPLSSYDNSYSGSFHR